MESANLLKRTGVMAKLGNREGFSLVEMAIVLVIIGVIIGAIMKGQDLILNSRAKQLASAASSWKNLAMAYLDRNGRLPGDGGRTGAITAQAGYSSATKEIQRSMTTAPSNPLVVGSMSFYMYFGNTAGKNVIVICKDATCGSVFTADELEMIKTVDTGIDGVSDAGLGGVRGATAATISTTSPAGYASSITIADTSTAGTSAQWTTANSYKAAVWAFDRPF